MNTEHMQVNGRELCVYRFNTIIVGSGAAGLNAAGQLHRLGQTDIAVVTEGLKMGTSRNTGSDKQTYYRLTVSGAEQDSVLQMARTLFDGGCMDGDLALCEAALSARSFYHLAELGVPFPHNRYGEYVGYKTDHDPCKRGTSAGPLTSKFMYECLLKDVQGRGIRIFDGHQAIELLTMPEGEGIRAAGIVTIQRSAVCSESLYTVFLAENVIYATGGEAGMYQTSVYPVSQTGGTGTALRAGARGKNLTESQYGLSSIRYRWNLSGTYQQVIPRYVSTDEKGENPQEFLDVYFDSPQVLLNAIFLKGYQWPFDPRKTGPGGSSLIDVAVYCETVIKKRRVFLDFTRNPSCSGVDGRIDFARIGETAYQYLKSSHALLPTPIERLAQMNQPAIDLYRRQGIDLYTDLLEVAVCAQHNNGGLAGNLWWESNISHFFPVGEVNGTHGVYRPGGSALNSGQVGSLRASEFIAQNYTGEPLHADAAPESLRKQVQGAVGQGDRWMEQGRRPADPQADRRKLGERMSRYGAHIRSLDGVRQALEQAREQLSELTGRLGARQLQDLPLLYRNRDLLVSQIVYLSAIEDYILAGGQSRGSYLIQQEDGMRISPELPPEFACRLDDGAFSGRVQEISYCEGECRVHWRPVRPIPEEDQWFETVWKAYLEKQVIR